MDKIKKKLVIVGDTGCGKTSLLMVSSTNKRLDECPPKKLEYVAIDVDVGGNEVELILYNTEGSDEELTYLRDMTYRYTDVFLMCYSIDNPDSLSNIEIKWMPDVKRICPNVPIILVGNKKDLWTDPETRIRLAERSYEPINTTEGLEISRKINAYAFVETSAKHNAGVREMLEFAAQIA